MNSRLDELHAAILSERLKWLDEFTERRKQIAEAYHLGINNPLIQQLSKPKERSAHVYHLFAVVCTKRDDLQAHLQKKGIQSLIHYPIPVHHQEPLKNIGRDPNGLANSEEYAKHCLSLPCHPQMSDLDVEKVINNVNEFRP
jgi:dTDP-4-amino-4,6-dideoxygalactose transaminase